MHALQITISQEISAEQKTERDRALLTRKEESVMKNLVEELTNNAIDAAGASSRILRFSLPQS
jgi:hypothetical protein